MLGVTFDGASVNRRLVKLHNLTSTLLYKVPNIHASDNRKLYFISDPPHLIKTVRNCWNSKCRSLWVYTIILTIFDTVTQSSFLYFSQYNGKHISWRHLQQLYEQDRGKATGLSLVPKLKYEHVYLTPFSKMRVDLAAQVCLGIRTYVCI